MAGMVTLAVLFAMFTVWLNPLQLRVTLLAFLVVNITVSGSLAIYESDWYSILTMLARSQHTPILKVGTYLVVALEIESIYPAIYLLWNIVSKSVHPLLVRYVPLTILELIVETFLPITSLKSSENAI